MKTKLITTILIGVLLMGIGIAGVSNISITPRDTKLETKLTKQIMNRLDNDFRNIRWDEKVEFTDGINSARGLLLWEGWNGTDWNAKSSRQQLWVNYKTESFVCNSWETDWYCSDKGNILVEDFLNIKMQQVADKFFYKKYKRLPDIEDKQNVDVGKKTIGGNK